MKIRTNQLKVIQIFMHNTHTKVKTRQSGRSLRREKVNKQLRWKAENPGTAPITTQQQRREQHRTTWYDMKNKEECQQTTEKVEEKLQV